MTKAKKLSYIVNEDNAGGLSLAVFENDQCIWFAANFEEQPRGALSRSLAALDAGADPRIEFDGGHRDPASAWDIATASAQMWIVASSGEKHFARMGNAAAREFVALDPSIFEEWQDQESRTRPGWFGDRFDPGLDEAREIGAALDGGEAGAEFWQARAVQWAAWANSEHNARAETTIEQWIEMLKEYGAGGE